MLDLNALLTAQGYDPTDVIVLRHRPYEPALNKVLPWLAAERSELFDAYQQCHGRAVEAALQKSNHVAAFIGMEPATATFVGLYRVTGYRPLTREAYWAIPEHQALRELGMVGWKSDDPRSVTLQFDLERCEFHNDWRGKLRIGWPPPERSWWRRAHRNVMPVLAISDDSAFVPKVVDWRELVRTWHELKIMPTSLKAKLSEWRGIYYIYDSSDGLGYVGSAGGTENLLGRWLGYAKSGHGDNKLLRARNPENFVFSILQRTSPDMPQDQLVNLESSWKRRLHTRAPNGLNEN